MSKLEVGSCGKTRSDFKPSFFGKNVATPKIRGVFRWKNSGSLQTKLFGQKRCNVKIRGVLRWKNSGSHQTKLGKLGLTSNQAFLAKTWSKVEKLEDHLKPSFFGKTLQCPN
jgi:hypothetical protein